MNHKVDDQNMGFISQLYPDVYTQIVPQGEVKPPKRRRKKRKVAVAAGDGSNCMLRKRKLTDEQVNMLEMRFGDEHKLESERKDKIAAELGLDPRQVAVWFQNRRTRWKNKRLEDEYNKLKNAHDNVVLDKCRLESEVLKLKEHLYDAEREIQRLAERVEGCSSNSPVSSSVSIQHNETPFFGDYEVEEDGDDYDNMVYPVPENTYIDHGEEWMNYQLNIIF
ncbi:Homeobox-leucine zipper protein ATHB-40 [Raphanus sativus]|uniref:Homeobox-leucine zipper protein n=1 Tax=Raphanus sativus TaxID=3726 RepID=A0A6J0KPI6_RAPSA|nr:homeobox-leucine zipper protein ATHB-40 isoform X2 [Raphanus sativus]KAJ4873811.1 Homeobox-leucine zipper protein ATHB-40 [Raphanus sativus]